MPNRKNYDILICVGERYKILKHPIRGSVGTGRRARLRILWWLHRVGSSPIFRIKPGFVRVQAFYFSDPLPLHSIPSNKNQPGRKRVLTHAQPGFSFPSFKKSHFSTPSPRPLPYAPVHRSDPPPGIPHLYWKTAGRRIHSASGRAGIQRYPPVFQASDSQSGPKAPG